MGRKVDIDHLVGTREIAERFGFRHAQSVHHLRRTDPSFPSPVFGTDGVSSAMVWYWPDIARWARQSGRAFDPQRDGSAAAAGMAGEQQ